MQIKDLNNTRKHGLSNYMNYLIIVEDFPRVAHPIPNALIPLYNEAIAL